MFPTVSISCTWDSKFEIICWLSTLSDVDTWSGTDSAWAESFSLTELPRIWNKGSILIYAKRKFTKIYRQRRIQQGVLWCGHITKYYLDTQISFIYNETIVVVSYSFSSALKNYIYLRYTAPPSKFRRMRQLVEGLGLGKRRTNSSIANKPIAYGKACGR